MACVGGYNAYSDGVCGELWCGGVVVCVLVCFGVGEEMGGPSPRGAREILGMLS